MLSKHAVHEYQEVYKKVHGKDISYARALEEGTKLLRLFQIVYKPIPKDWNTKTQKYSFKKK